MAFLSLPVRGGWPPARSGGGRGGLSVGWVGSRFARGAAHLDSNNRTTPPASLRSAPPLRGGISSPQIQFLEEVVAFVVDDDEGGEILDLDLPDRLHAELGIFEHVDLLDAVLGEVGGGA